MHQLTSPLLHLDESPTHQEDEECWWRAAALTENTILSVMSAGLTIHHRRLHHQLYQRILTITRTGCHRSIRGKLQMVWTVRFKQEHKPCWSNKMDRHALTEWQVDLFTAHTETLFHLMPDSKKSTSCLVIHTQSEKTHICIVGILSASASLSLSQAACCSLFNSSSACEQMASPMPSKPQPSFCVLSLKRKKN